MMFLQYRYNDIKLLMEPIKGPGAFIRVAAVIKADTGIDCTVAYAVRGFIAFHFDDEGDALVFQLRYVG